MSILYTYTILFLLNFFPNHPNFPIITNLQKYNIIVTDADLPSRDTVGRTGLDDVYCSMLLNVKDQILVDKALQLAMTFDLWTDGYRRLNYITFTLHYLSSGL